MKKSKLKPTKSKPKRKYKRRQKQKQKSERLAPFDSIPTLVHDGSKFRRLAPFDSIPATPKSKFRIKLFKANSYQDKDILLLNDEVNNFIASLDFNKFRDVQIQDTVIMVVYEE